MTDNSVAGILKRIEDAQAASLPGQKSMDRLTLHYLANLAVAKEIADAYAAIERALQDIDILKASGTKLEAIVSHVLIEGRLLGDYATGGITFRSAYPVTSEIAVPAGTKCYALLEDGSKLYFITTAEGRIPVGETSVTVAARAEERGISGNVAAYQIIGMVSRITGVVSCENQLDFTGGTPDETDDELRERYFDAIQAPGKATAIMIQRALNDLPTVSEVRVWSYGSGDMGILVSYSGGIAETSEDIVNTISENIAAGTQARGCLAATIDGDQVVVLSDDVYGALIWARPRCFISAEEVLTITYLNMSGVEKEATVTVPAGTHRGEMVAATMNTPSSRAKRILEVSGSPAGNSYDILLGMGAPGYLYNLPELIEVDVVVKIRLTDIPETDLVDLIRSSLAAFLGSRVIGERLEYSDVVRFVYNQYDEAATDCIGRPFIGIDELVELVVSGGGQVATKNGDRVTVEEDWRIEAGDVDIFVIA